MYEIDNEFVPDYENSLSYTLNNNTDEVLCYTYFEYLECEHDGEWYSMEPDDSLAYLLGGIYINPGESFYIEDEWLLEHYNISPEHYRIIHRIGAAKSVNGEADYYEYDPDNDFYIAYEFDIE